MNPLLPNLAAGSRNALLLLFVFLTTSLRAGDPDAFVDGWLAAQRSLKTWSADFIQTRSLKALKEPLKTPGRLWFAAPDRFRWELGVPAQTIALRDGNELLVVYPRLRRVERYPLSGNGAEAWRGALALLDAGFATNRAALESRFQIVSQDGAGESRGLVLEPRAASARRFMTQVRLEIDPKTHAMLANEMRFADGSALRNDFTNAVVNPAIPDPLFHFDIPDGFKVVEPAAP
ncbi:MAG: outer membrane lipoprotein carrier protein LolA [Verrucomicrobiales bacterium]|nr:outer membrane lipoprotein carrier protein LolA [Verrucomicrobiales bacterium]